MKSASTLAARVMLASAASALFAGASRADDSTGVVSHINVVSDKVEDVSSLEAWKKSFIKPGMTDKQKALVVWESVVKFRHQDPPPNEYLLGEGNVHDPIKSFNVYGYGMCCCASANIAALARYAGLEARGWGIVGHSVPEVKVDGNWCMFDASLINYFTKSDGSIAGVEEVSKSIDAWYAAHPDYRGNNDKLYKFGMGNGWKNGPPAMVGSRFYDENGWLPAATHGWYSSMSEFGSPTKNFVYEYGAAVGYEVNLQVRPGEKLIRNWSNTGLHVNMLDGDAPGALTAVVGKDQMRYSPAYGDLAPGRVGNGQVIYDVPLAGGALAAAALESENLASTTDNSGKVVLHAKDAAMPATFVLRMPSSYVYLDGKIELNSRLSNRCEIGIQFSDNNGLDWKPLEKITAAGKHEIALKSLIFRRYDYRLKFTLKGEGTGLDMLRISETIQHSQRVLPALDKGDNKIHFSTGPQEGTITIQGAINGPNPPKNLVYSDFHPTLQSVDAQWVRPLNGAGTITFPVHAPGDLTRLRIGIFYRARDARDGWNIQASFDDGKTWSDVGQVHGPYQGNSTYLVFNDVPPAHRDALLRFSGVERNTTLIEDLRIGADYREPHGRFVPVRITYAWDENGQRHTDVHVAKTADETYTLHCDEKPFMKSITLEVP